jgi:hypothetical protein
VDGVTESRVAADPLTGDRIIRNETRELEI